MAVEPQKDRFIPFRKTDVVKMCTQDPRLPEDKIMGFRELNKILEAVFHFEFHQRLEALKNCYGLFNPDADTRAIYDHSEEEKRILEKRLVPEMTAVLNAANFEKITPEDLEQALAEESLFKVRLEVDFDDFEDMFFFRCSKSQKQATVKELYGLWKKILRSPISSVRMKTINRIIIGVPAAVSGIIVVVSKLGASLLLVGSVIAFRFGLTEQDTQINQRHLIACGVDRGRV